MPSFEQMPFAKPRKKEGGGVGVLEAGVDYRSSSKPWKSASSSAETRPSPFARPMAVHEVPARRGTILQAEPTGETIDQSNSDRTFIQNYFGQQIAQIDELQKAGDSQGVEQLKEFLVRSAAENHPIPPQVRDMLISRKRWVILDELGHGGMGTVYHAFDLTFGRPVALKLLLPYKGQTVAEESQQRFDREGKIWARLGFDPSVVKLYDAGVCEQGGFIAMDLIEGEDLAKQMEHHGTYSVEEAAQIGADVGRGLSILNRAGIVHRDLKPANILYSQERKMHSIADFGLAMTLASKKDAQQAAARFIDERPSIADTKITKDDDVGGTWEYMAPEQAISREEVTPAADISSLGSILYEALTGELPTDLLQRIKGEPVTPIQQKRPDLPPEFAELIMEMLATGPTDRPSVDEVIYRLRPFLPETRIDISTSTVETKKKQRLPATATSPRRFKAAKSERHHKQVARIFSKWFVGSDEEDEQDVN